MKKKNCSSSGNVEASTEFSPGSQASKDKNSNGQQSKSKSNSTKGNCK